MKVSIIMPVYNRQKYLAEAINSALDQTYDNIELIIIDDGSSDTSLDIANDYANKYPDKIKTLSQKNAGASTARNKGIESATGDLIAFLDSDDLYEKNKIEEQVKLYKQYPNAGFVYCDYYIVNNKNKILKIVESSEYMTGNIYNKLWLSSFELSGGSVMVTKKKMIEVGGFNIDLAGSENVDLRLKLSLLGPVYYVAKPLCRYRRHDSNITLESNLMDDCIIKLITMHLGHNGNLNPPLWRKVMSIYNYKLGMRCFSQTNYKSAIGLFLNSIKFNVIQTKSYIQILRCLLGKRINNSIKKLKNNQI
tara:strand:- start:18426 stop:19346 length:921 start_codon:yes stop_codon:yes gene_type:complete